MVSSSSNSSNRWLYMAGLMLAGESIYMLPYMRKTFYELLGTLGVGTLLKFWI